MNPTIACPLECGVLLQPVDDNSDCCINNNIITHKKHNYFLLYLLAAFLLSVTFWSPAVLMLTPQVCPTESGEGPMFPPQNLLKYQHSLSLLITPYHSLLIIIDEALSVTFNACCLRFLLAISAASELCSYF